MVRYGGTIAAAVPSNVSRKPDSSASRYGLAKRHSRSSAQVDDGAACSRWQTGHSSASSGIGLWQMMQARSPSCCGGWPDRRMACCASNCASRRSAGGLQASVKRQMPRRALSSCNSMTAAPAWSASVRDNWGPYAQDSQPLSSALRAKRRLSVAATRPGWNFSRWSRSISTQASRVSPSVSSARISSRQRAGKASARPECRFGFSLVRIPGPRHCPRHCHARWQSCFPPRAENVSFPYNKSSSRP